MYYYFRFKLHEIEAKKNYIIILLYKGKKNATANLIETFFGIPLYVRSKM